MYCSPNWECFTVDRFSLFETKPENIELIPVICVLVFSFWNVVQTNLGGECSLKTINIISVVYESENVNH